MTKDHQIIAATILKQIMGNRDEFGNRGSYLMMCWGYRQPMVVEYGVQFRVSGKKHKGWVQIKLVNDLYDITFMKSNGLIVSEDKGIDCEQLLMYLDGKIEK